MVSPACPRTSKGARVSGTRGEKHEPRDLLHLKTKGKANSLKGMEPASLRFTLTGVPCHQRMLSDVTWKVLWAGAPAPLLTSSIAVVVSPILSQKQMPCSLFSFEDFRFSALPTSAPAPPTKENLRDAEHWQNDLPSRETVIGCQSWKEPWKLWKVTPLKILPSKILIFFYSSFRFMAKLRGRYKDFPYIRIPTCVQPPLSITSHTGMVLL